MVVLLLSWNSDTQFYDANFVKLTLNSSEELIGDACLLGMYYVPMHFTRTFPFPLAIIAFRKSWFCKQDLWRNSLTQQLVEDLFSLWGSLLRGKNISVKNSHPTRWVSYNLRAIYCAPAFKQFSASAGCCVLGNNCGSSGNSPGTGKGTDQRTTCSRSTLLILVKARSDCSNHLLGTENGGMLSAFLRSEWTGKGRPSGPWQILEYWSHTNGDKRPYLSLVSLPLLLPQFLQPSQS